MNIVSLMLLFIFIYSVIGVNLFGSIMHSGPMSNYITFENVGKAFVVLIRVATGESWNDLMNALSLKYSASH